MSARRFFVIASTMLLDAAAGSPDYEDMRTSLDWAEEVEPVVVPKERRADMLRVAGGEVEEV